jgi:HSP20 family protein
VPAGPSAQSAQSAEPRSFEDTGSGQGLSAEALTRATQPFAEGARQLAEQSRQASRQVADSWRQAVDPLLAMQFEVSQWFDEMFRNALGLRHGASANPLRPVGLSPASFFGLPPADMREAAQAYTLAVELPGLALADIELRIDGDALVLSGHKSEEIDDASAAYRVSERRYGRFERSFPLPPDVERERIEAQFKDGVLKVLLPKNATAAPRGARIEVKG